MDWRQQSGDAGWRRPAQGDSAGRAETLTSFACLLGFLGLWGPSDPGRLTLWGGVVTFVSARWGLVFSEQVGALQVRFPAYLGMGLKLRVAGRRRRICFLPMSWGSTGMSGGDFSNATGNSWALSDMGPARVTAQQWQAALLEPGKGAPSQTTPAPNAGGLLSPGPGVSAPPQYSRGHRWWWDGARWTPSLPVERAAATVDWRGDTMAGGAQGKAAMPSESETEPPEPPSTTPPTAGH